MAPEIKCKACGSTDFALTDYESLLALSSDLAVFTLRCPHCKTPTVVVCSIPEEIRADIDAAADKLGAGMGGTRSAGR